MDKNAIKKYAISIFRGILLFGMCFMILQPILNKISVSFMTEQDLFCKPFTVIGSSDAADIFDPDIGVFIFKPGSRLIENPVGITVGCAPVAAGIDADLQDIVRGGIIQPDRTGEHDENRDDENQF